jgi:uroporphyrinogen III methyltransferase / synthase
VRGQAADPSALPLLGCRVVVTRPRPQSAALDERLTEMGATVLSFPTIAISDPTSFDDLDAGLRGLGDGVYEWTVFLSANSVEKVVDRIRALSEDPTLLARSRIAAVGGVTAEALAAHAITVDLVPEVPTSAGVAEAFGTGTGRILVPRAAGAPRDAMDELRSQGWLVDEVVAYRTVSASEGLEPSVVRDRNFDVVTFTSGSTVRGFAAAVGPSEAGLSPEDSGGHKVVCIGPTTARVAAELGFRVDAIATQPSAAGLVDAVIGLARGL